MDIGVIDVTEWQTVVDMRDGQPLQISHPRIDLASRICAAHPYPGDLAGKGAQWVTEVALDLNVRYKPDYFFLDYASVYLQLVFGRSGPAERAVHIAAVFGEIERFLAATGFTPVIVGLGGMMPFGGYIETIDLECLVSAGGMNTRAAGLFAPSASDLARIGERQGVAQVLSREDLRARFGGCEAFYRACPDYVVMAAPGYVFRGVNVGCRPLHQVPSPDASVPLHTPLAGGETITDIPDLVLKGLEKGRTALILVEGVGCETFPLAFRPLSNCLHGYCYTMGPDQYLALTSGLHLVDYSYPPGYRYELYDEPEALYPFSGLFEYLPEQTIGRRFAGPSAGVGNRSIMTHLAAGTDITVECFARALYNHGVMAIVRT